tara:strand:- start:602 stop:850 length:249 start_codon:yes stop_codon:yes gene_type:complete
MINYKVLKSASKVSLSTTDVDGEFKITKKTYDPDTGEAQDDQILLVTMPIVDAEIENHANKQADEKGYKEDWEQLKVDLGAL